jgi:hypothetical protein
MSVCVCVEVLVRIFCIMALYYTLHLNCMCLTVGTQSIACAQSIVCCHIDDNICQKTEFLKNYFLKRLNEVNQQHILEQKSHF